MNKNLILQVTAFSFFFILSGAVQGAWSSQMQWQSPGGSGSSSSSSSSSSGSKSDSKSDSKSEDADYAVWPHGGGKVHRLAQVAASALIDSSSKVGAHVIVSAGAKIQSSLLSGQSASQPARIGASAVVESSTLQGAFSIGAGAKVKSTLLQGPIRIDAGRTILSCTLSAMGDQPVTLKEDMTGEMKMYPQMN